MIDIATGLMINNSKRLQLPSILIVFLQYITVLENQKVGILCKKMSIKQNSSDFQMAKTRTTKNTSDQVELF